MWCARRGGGERGGAAPRPLLLGAPSGWLSGWPRPSPDYCRVSAIFRLMFVITAISPDGRRGNATSSARPARLLAARCRVVLYGRCCGPRALRALLTCGTTLNCRLYHGNILNSKRKDFGVAYPGLGAADTDESRRSTRAARSPHRHRPPARCRGNVGGPPPPPSARRLFPGFSKALFVTIRFRISKASGVLVDTGRSVYLQEVPSSRAGGDRRR